MLINVLPKHIYEGLPLNVHRCPVALALNEATNNVWMAEAYRLTNTTTGKVYRTPERCSDFMDNFCRYMMNKAVGYCLDYQQPQPFQFELSNELITV